jgi:type VI secretion system lysozyme-like protein
VNKTNYVPSSLLYRLTDENPSDEHDVNFSVFVDIAMLQHDIKQNLESILNTRLAIFTLPEKTELSRSILSYGINDFTQISFMQQHAQIQLCRYIEDTISYFEPRLKNIRVTQRDVIQDSNRNLCLLIKADIYLKPYSKPTMFETNLDIISQLVDVAEELS